MVTSQLAELLAAPHLAGREGRGRGPPSSRRHRAAVVGRVPHEHRKTTTLVAALRSDPFWTTSRKRCNPDTVLTIKTEEDHCEKDSGNPNDEEASMIGSIPRLHGLRFRRKAPFRTVIGKESNTSRFFLSVRYSGWETQSARTAPAPNDSGPPAGGRPRPHSGSACTRPRPRGRRASPAARKPGTRVVACVASTLSSIAD